MSELDGLRALADGAVISPFTRTRRLLDGVAPIGGRRWERASTGVR